MKCDFLESKTFDLKHLDIQTSLRYFLEDGTCFEKTDICWKIGT